MRQEPTTDQLPIAGATVEFPSTPADPSQPVGETVEFPVSRAAERVGGHPPESGQGAPPRRRSQFWRELTGALAAGTVLLAATVLVLQVVAWVQGMPGLGVGVLGGHLAGAVLAVVAQRIVDRRAGKLAFLAGLGLCVVVAAILVLFWWI